MYRLLLVEDDKTIVTNLTAFLRSEGFEVKSASGNGVAILSADAAGSISSSAPARITPAKPSMIS